MNGAKVPFDSRITLGNLIVVITGLITIIAAWSNLKADAHEAIRGQERNSAALERIEAEQQVTSNRLTRLETLAERRLHQ